MNVRYEIVKHNDTLFTVFSHVRSKDWDGSFRDFKNFVAECDSHEKAEAIVFKLVGL